MFTRNNVPPVAALTDCAGARRATSARNAPFQPLAVAPRTKNNTHEAATGHAGVIAAHISVDNAITAPSSASALKQSRNASATHPQNKRPAMPPACEAIRINPACTRPSFISSTKKITVKVSSASCITTNAAPAMPNIRSA